MNRIYFVAVLLCAVFYSFAQIPANDSCESAFVLTPNVIPQYDTFRITDATSDTTGCQDSRDVWFKFEMPSTGGIRIIGERYQLSESPSFRLYTGACNALNIYACEGTCDYYRATNCGTSLLLKDPSLAGDTLYVRVSRYYTFTSGDSGAIAIQHVLDADFPANDSCGSAAILSPNSSLTMDTFSLENSLTELSTGYCRDNEDVWFKFEVPASGGFKVRQDKYNQSTELGLQVYTDGCTTKTLYECAGACNYYNATGNCGTYLQVIDPSLAGDTLWVRASPYYNFDNRDSFAIGIEEIPTVDIRINDTCGGAIDVSNTLTTGYDSFTLYNASTELTTDYCRDNEDIWFKFEVPASGAFEINQQTYKMNNDLTFRMYEGTCASLSTYACDSNCNYIDAGNCGAYLRVVDSSLIGDTMYLRASAYYDFSPRDSFSFRIEEIPTVDIIQNDICADAFVLPTNVTLTYDTFTNVNALAETATSCRDDEDVWFKFEVPSSGAFELDVKNVTAATSFSMQLWTGECGSLSVYECDSNCNYLDDDNTCSDNFLIRDTSLAGDSVYVRVSNYYDFSLRGEFEIAIRDIPVLSLPSNDDCQQAMVLPVSTGGCLVDTFNNKNTTASVLPTTCNNYSGSDVWFKFEMPASDDAFIQMSQVSDASKDFQIAAYSGTCGSLTQIGCNNSDFYPSLSLRNLSLAGDSVFIHVYRRSTSEDGDTFGICVIDTVLPPLRSTVGQYEENTGCAAINGNTWFDLVDSSGNLVASVNPQGSNLGTVCFGINIEDSTSMVRVALDTFGNTAFLAPRNFYISPFRSNVGAEVKLYYKERELKIWRDSLANRGEAVGPTLEDFYTDSMRINKTDGASLSNYLGTNPVSINPTITTLQDSIIVAQFTVTSFSNFVTVFNPGNATVPVPVEWVRFDAERRDDIIQLQWITASELNCSHFEVQRSVNGRDFSTIGIERGNGTKSSMSRYTFWDETPVAGKAYYRLKQIDYDGAFDYSSIAVVLGKDAVQALPNPFTNELTITSGTVYIERVELVDMFGRLVYTQAVDDTKIILQLPTEIDHGMYTLRVVTEFGVSTRKVIKH